MIPFFCVALALGAGGDSVDETRTVLEAGVEKWTRDVSFRATYTLRQGLAASVEAGLANGIDPTLSDPKVPAYEARGLFNKMGRLIRYSADFGRPAAELAGRSEEGNPNKLGFSQRVVHLVSFDEISNGVLQVAYMPEGPGVVGVTLRTPDVTGIGVHSVGFPNPVQPHGNPRFRPLRLWDLGDGVNLDPERKKVTHLPGQRIQVELEQGGSHKLARRVVFWTVPSPPVIVEIDDTITEPTGASSSSSIRMSDFRRCSAGHVARRVRSVSSLGSGLVRVQDWTSDDLGERAPTRSDFVLKVPASTAVGGLKQLPPLDGVNRVIDIEKLSPDDLGSLDPSAGVHRGRSPNLTRVVVALNVLVVLLLAGYVLYRRSTQRRARSIPPSPA